MLAVRENVSPSTSSTDCSDRLTEDTGISDFSVGVVHVISNKERTVLKDDNNLFMTLNSKRMRLDVFYKE